MMEWWCREYPPERVRVCCEMGREYDEGGEDIDIGAVVLWASIGSGWTWMSGNGSYAWLR